MICLQQVIKGFKIWKTDKFIDIEKEILSILCLKSRTTMTSVRILEEDTCHRARNLCIFSRVQKGIPGLTHKWCVLQRVSLGALRDVTVVLGMRQSIDKTLLYLLCVQAAFYFPPWWKLHFPRPVWKGTKMCVYVSCATTDASMLLMSRTLNTVQL